VWRWSLFASVLVERDRRLLTWQTTKKMASKTAVQTVLLFFFALSSTSVVVAADDEDGAECLKTCLSGSQAGTAEAFRAAASGSYQTPAIAKEEAEAIKSNFCLRLLKEVSCFKHCGKDVIRRLVQLYNGALKAAPFLPAEITDYKAFDDHAEAIYASKAPRNDTKYAQDRFLCLFGPSSQPFSFFSVAPSRNTSGFRAAC